MFLKHFVIALPISIAIDMFWLTVIAKDFYRAQIGNFMRPDINWAAAAIFYLIFITGLVTFVVFPAVERGSWIYALLLGALFGFVCYATYDLTNLAVAKDWPLLVAVVDLIWGAVLASSVSTITYFIAAMLAP